MEYRETQSAFGLNEQELEDKFIQTMLLEIVAGTIFAAWLIWAAILFA